MRSTFEPKNLGAGDYICPMQRTELWRLPIRLSVVVARVLLPLGIAFFSNAWALSTAAPASAGAKLVFRGSESALSSDQSASLDRAAAEMATRCGSDWASRSWLMIEYSVAPRSLPRRDYQLIGERAERIRGYMEKFNPKQTRVLIDISDGPFDGTANSGEDHSVSVRMMCSL